MSRGREKEFDKLEADEICDCGCRKGIHTIVGYCPKCKKECW